MNLLEDLCELLLDLLEIEWVFGVEMKLILYQIGLNVIVGLLSWGRWLLIV